MQTAALTRDLQTSGIQSQAAFGISLKDQAKIANILRDALYSDKVLAVLREYGSNAWDAHRVSGKADLPIEITLPTNMSPTLTIRDFGPGMSEDDIFKIYTQYGASTKDADNDGIGMMGIGSKSGFAYTDTFTVTSWNGGWKKVYVAVLDETDMGVINKLFEEPCDPTETGIEIQISVKPLDVPEFHRKAKGLFTYFEPLPKINCYIPQVVRNKKQHGFFSESETGWVAVMGPVPYKIDITHVQKELEELGLWVPLSKTNGGLYFNIGEVQIVASREELKYSTFTKKALIAKFQGMVDAYVEDILETLRDATISNWQKRAKAVFLNMTMKLNLPDRYRQWSYTLVSVWDASAKIPVPAPSTFTLLNGSQATSNLHVSINARLVLRDDITRSFKGFRLTPHDVIVRPVEGASMEDVRTELDLYLAQAQLDGIPICNLSSIPWFKPYAEEREKRHAPANPKHSVRTFKLVDTNGYHALSANWAIEKRTPTPGDVFVLLDHFKVLGCPEFYSKYREDAALAKALGSEMPPVYGYKIKATGPILKANVTGTEYRDWRPSFLKGLVTPEIRAHLEHFKFALLDTEPDSHSIYGRRSESDIWQKIMAVDPLLRAALPPSNCILQMLSRHKEGVAALAALPVPLRVALSNLVDQGPEVELEADKLMQGIYARYPILQVAGGISVLARKQHVPQWIEYILLIESQHGVNKP